jgi:hypothetical protein
MPYGFGIGNNTQPKQTGQTGYGFGIKGSQPTIPTTPSVIKTLPDFLGGGAYNSVFGQPNTLVNTGHSTYGGEQTQAGKQRDDIVPVGLGGANTQVENIKLTPLKQATQADKVEQQAINDFKSGKLSLPEARLQVLTAKQQQTAESQGVSTNPYSLTNILKGVKSIFLPTAKTVQNSITSNSTPAILQQSNKGQLAQALPQTTQALKDLKTSATTLPSVSHQTATDILQGKQSLIQSGGLPIRNAILAESAKIKDAFASFTSKQPVSTSQEISRGIGVATGLAGIAFSPISGLFAMAKNIPIINTLANLISLPFAVTGDIGGNIAVSITDALPISPEAKDNLNDSIKEAGSLAGQILLGGELVKGGQDFLKGKVAELTPKFGEDGAKTVVDVAVKKALNTPDEAMPKAETPSEPVYNFGVKKEADPLTLEAQKYKTAEDFVKAQGENKLYHVSNNPNLKIDKNYSPKQGQLGKGFYVTKDPEIWQGGQIGKRPYVYEVNTNNLKLADNYPTRNELIDWGSKEGYYKNDFLKKPNGEYVLGQDGKPMKVWQETPKAEKLMDYKDPMTGNKMSGLEQEYLKAKGYDGTSASYSPDGEQAVIFNYDKIKLSPTKTKSQLTDIWNKAQQPVETADVKNLTYEPTTAKASIPERIKTETLAQGLQADFSGISEYDKVNFKDQAERVNQIIENNPDQAVNIALGKELPTNGALPESVFIAVKNQALKDGNVELLRRLATEEGGVAKESTILGQRIKMLDEKKTEDAFSQINKVVKERQKVKDKNLKDENPTKTKSDIKNKLKEKVSKEKPNKYDWNKLIEEIACK